MPSSPQNESPCGAVPESSEQHGDNQVDVGSYVAFTVSSKRNVEVVFQPAGEEMCQRRQNSVMVADL